jgi:hypothetical protein
VFIAWPMYGIECKGRRLVLEEQSASFSNCDQQLCMKLDNHCLWRNPRSQELNSIQFICISISLLMLNKLLDTWCGDYCKCVRPAQLPVLTEVRAPSLWEQHPWYVPHRDHPGYNTKPGLANMLSSRKVSVALGHLNGFINTFWQDIISLPEHNVATLLT